MTDLFLHNARIWTGAPEAPWAEAALIRGGRFVFAGRERDVVPPAGVSAYDAGGRLVLPGLIDGHAHLLSTGLVMRSVDLKGVSSIGEAARRVGERVASTPAEGWVRGAGWDQHLWPGARFPSRLDLDAGTPKQPVVLIHTSGHCLWVNSAALRAAGVSSSTQAPAGGAIDRDEDGEPTGIVRDEAMGLIYAAMPAPSQDERVAAVADAVAHAQRLGLSCVHAMDAGRGELRALWTLHERGELRLRVRAYLTARRLGDWLGNVRTGDGDSLLRAGGVKFFADGALGSLTAWLLEPYEGSADTGLVLTAPEELEAQVRACLEAGLAPAVHAIGDRANRAVLDCFEQMLAIAPELPRRIEHAQLLSADDLERFARLGVIASMQPIHATQDMAKVDSAWGARGRGAYAFGSLLRSGAQLAFGSDSPVESMDPLAGIHAAVTRRSADGEPPSGWNPKERIALEDALAAYTTGCARATGDEHSLGRIAEGYHGDFAVISHDLFVLEDPMQLLDARVDATVVGGEIVYERAR